MAIKEFEDKDIRSSPDIENKRRLPLNRRKKKRHLKLNKNL